MQTETKNRIAEAETNREKARAEISELLHLMHECHDNANLIARLDARVEQLWSAAYSS